MTYDLSEVDRSSGANTGIILERFIRSNEDYKEEFYVVWFPSWEGRYISKPAVAILSIDELTIHE